MSTTEHINAFLDAAERGDEQGLQRGLAQEVDVNCSNRQGRTRF